MAAIKGLIVPITASYDGKGVNQAISAMGTLESAAKKVTGVIAGVFATQKIIAFGRASVDAFANSQKEAALLNTTLSNLGIAIQGVGLNSYLTKLSETTGVLKSDLLPAFQSLVTTTHSVASAQDVLNTALDVSAGTGRDLQSVSDALAKAYNGNFAALKKMGLGLTAADLASKNFATIQTKLNTLFKGDAKTASDSYQGSINKLKTGFEELQVTVGQGLVQAFINLGGKNGSIDQTITAMQTLGNTTAFVLAGLGNVFGIGKNTKKQSAIDPLLLTLIGSAGVGIRDLLGKLADKANYEAWVNATKSNTDNLAQYYKTLDSQKALAKSIADQEAKANAANTAAQQKSLALEKQKQVLIAAGRVTDLQQIEITAALMQTQDQGTIDRLNLQKALLDQNTTAAGDLAQKVLAANLAALQSTAVDPFGNWATGALAAINSIKDLQAELAKLGSATISAPTVVSTTTAAAVTAADIINGTGYVSSTGVSSNDPNAGTFAQYYQGTSGGLYGSTPVNVVVSVDKSGNLIANVQNGLNQATANGSPNNINRLNYNFNN